MGWLRNALVFPDDIWREAADKLGGEFVQGRWLANSEINFNHRDYKVTLGVRTRGNSDNSTQYTQVMPEVALRPGVKLLLFPQMKGFLGSITSGLMTKSGKTVDLPALGDDYCVIGEDAELAERLFGHRVFMLALQNLAEAPTVAVGSSMRNWMDEDDEQEEEDFCVSVPSVVKDVHQLKAMLDLTKVLVDLLAENDCLANE